MCSGHGGRTLRRHSVLHGRTLRSAVLVQSPDVQRDPYPGDLRRPPHRGRHVLVRGVRGAPWWTHRVPVWTLPLRAATGPPHTDHDYTPESKMAGKLERIWFCLGSKMMGLFTSLLWCLNTELYKHKVRTGRARSYLAFSIYFLFAIPVPIFLPSPPTFYCPWKLLNGFSWTIERGRRKFDFTFLSVFNSSKKNTVELWQKSVLQYYDIILLIYHDESFDYIIIKRQ